MIACQTLSGHPNLFIHLTVIGFNDFPSSVIVIKTMYVDCRGYDPKNGFFFNSANVGFFHNVGS